MLEKTVGHTPGPWEWDGEMPGPSKWRINEAGTGNCLAMVVGTADNLKPGQQAANAQLISACPEMLAALKRVRKGYGGLLDRATEDIINAAIHKAEVTEAS